VPADARRRRAGTTHARSTAQAGVFLCAHCHVLLALWDGKPSEQVGGTSQVVRFHHDDVMPGYTPSGTASRLILTDDESDLVYHVVCSRARPDGEPAAGLTPCDVWWYTTDDLHPRVKALPERHQRVFDRSSDFNRDVAAHSARIDASRSLNARAGASMPPDPGHQLVFARRTGSRFTTEAQVVHYDSHPCWGWVSRTCRTDYSCRQWLIFALLGMMMSGMVVSAIAGRGAWHRRV
jgi:hypothetical protein